MENKDTEVIANIEEEAAETQGQEIKVIDKRLQARKDNIKEWVRDLGMAAIVALLFLQFFMPTIVRQSSMEGTLSNGDYVFVSKRIYTWFKVDIKRGDIIVFQSGLPNGAGGEKLLVKRVIGVPGDRIEIKDGSVYVNGEALVEDYTKDGVTNGTMEEVTVPEKMLFVLGDNRQGSTDSRSDSVGFVDIDSVRGKVIFRLFPIRKAGAVD